MNIFKKFGGLWHGDILAIRNQQVGTNDVIASVRGENYEEETSNVRK